MPVTERTHVHVRARNYSVVVESELHSHEGRDGEISSFEKHPICLESNGQAPLSVCVSLCQSVAGASKRSTDRPTDRTVGCLVGW